MAYDEERQRKRPFLRGAYNYHRPMAMLHIEQIRQMRSDLANPFKVGDFVEPRSVSGKKVAVDCVGEILEHIIFTHRRTSKIYEPPQSNKYRIKWTYDSGWTIENWVQQRIVRRIKEEKYKAFFKLHKIKRKGK